VSIGASLKVAVICPHSEHPVVARECLVEAPQLVQGKATIRKRLGVIGPPQLVEDETTIRKCLSVVWLHFERGIDNASSLAVTSCRSCCGKEKDGRIATL
jgi:hypothetical protein